MIGVVEAVTFKPSYDTTVAADLPLVDASE
jgi:hypothetical protein